MAAQTPRAGPPDGFAEFAQLARLLTEQEEQIREFRAEQVETRRKLREVKRELRAEIDALGTRLKLLNIFLNIL